MLRCLEKDPALRPQTARELRDAYLDAIQRTVVVDPPGPEPPPPGPEPPSPGPPPRRLFRTRLGLALASAILLLVYLSPWSARPAPDVFQSILDDIRAQPASDRPFQRYFRISRRSTPEKPDRLRQALIEAINLTSRGSASVVPTPIDPEKTLFRVTSARRAGMRARTRSSATRRWRARAPSTGLT